MEIKKRFDNIPILVRFKKWCYSCLDIVKSLEYNNENKVIINQVVRSATSSYMNYRTVNRAKSKADMINKLKIVEEETDETIGWLEMIQNRNSTNTSYVRKEADELLRIVVSSIVTLRKNDSNNRTMNNRTMNSSFRLFKSFFVQIIQIILRSDYSNYSNH
ncbi:MAG: four helix bundle protein [Saprospiraceae bacterium]|nr:four helix bundle protein [Saprospiraceae bacterium]